LNWGRKVAFFEWVVIAVRIYKHQRVGINMDGAAKEKLTP
jgi:hypothetical protein